jgi:uncharacterized membrane protein
MTRKTFFLVALVLIGAVLLVTLAVYGQLPERIPVHWNARGQADGYGSRISSLIVMPSVMLAMVLLTALLPWLSPRRFELNGHNAAYLQIMLVTLAFIAYMHVVMLAAALGRHLNMTDMVMGAMCAMIAAMGIPLRKMQRNFFVGIRTPWTLASEKVWQATHRFAAKTFVIGGLVGLAVAFLSHAIWPPMIAVGVAALAPVIHSLAYYKQLERRGEV